MAAISFTSARLNHGSARTGRMALAGDVETHMSRFERPLAQLERANHFANVQRSP
jgi:predicted lysophospholipase L1 biosynthesis ABC-type transport system permease subunit